MNKYVGTNRLELIFSLIKELVDKKANKATTLSGYGITDAIPVSQLGKPNGVAQLDKDGRISSENLPESDGTVVKIVRWF